MLIRRGDVGDLGQVLDLERASERAPHWAAERYAAALQGEGGMLRRVLFVAVEHGVVQGFAVGQAVGVGNDAEAELESVVVREAERRRGVGRALCRAVMEWARDEGAMAMLLEVRAGSVGAIRLYLGLGFALVGRRAGYYAAPVEDALVMRCGLWEVLRRGAQV